LSIGSVQNLKSFIVIVQEREGPGLIVLYSLDLLPPLQGFLLPEDVVFFALEWALHYTDFSLFPIDFGVVVLEPGIA